mmetsp:Transcript_96771/g.252244  ORF Transcript_96771/g.252244 Transcript_96771/m.252244 type:complete len:275 (-) Transcript_96771:809-1633(-)
MGSSAVAVRSLDGSVGTMLTGPKAPLLATGGDASVDPAWFCKTYRRSRLKQRRRSRRKGRGSQQHSVGARSTPSTHAALNGEKAALPFPGPTEDLRHFRHVPEKAVDARLAHHHSWQKRTASRQQAWRCSPEVPQRVFGPLLRVLAGGDAPGIGEGLAPFQPQAHPRYSRVVVSSFSKNHAEVLKDMRLHVETRGRQLVAGHLLAYHHILAPFENSIAMRLVGSQIRHQTAVSYQPLLRLVHGFARRFIGWCIGGVLRQYVRQSGGTSYGGAGR